jgi:hypothetical protein
MSLPESIIQNYIDTNHIDKKYPTLHTHIKLFKDDAKNLATGNFQTTNPFVKNDLRIISNVLKGKQKCPIDKSWQVNITNPLDNDRPVSAGLCRLLSSTLPVKSPLPQLQCNDPTNGPYPANSDQGQMCNAVITASYAFLNNLQQAQDAQNIYTTLVNNPKPSSCNLNTYGTNYGKAVCENLLNQVIPPVQASSAPSPLQYITSDVCGSNYKTDKTSLQMCSKAVNGVSSSDMAVDSSNPNSIIYADASIINQGLLNNNSCASMASSFQTNAAGDVCNYLSSLITAAKNNTPTKAKISAANCLKYQSGTDARAVCLRAVNNSCSNANNSDLKQDCNTIYSVITPNPPKTCPIASKFNTKGASTVCNDLLDAVKKSAIKPPPLPSSIVARGEGFSNIVETIDATTVPSTITPIPSINNVSNVCNYFSSDPVSQDTCIRSIQGTYSSSNNSQVKNDSYMINTTISNGGLCSDIVDSISDAGLNVCNYISNLINNPDTVIPLNAPDNYCNTQYAAGSTANIVCNNAVNDTCSNLSDPKQIADCNAIYQFLNNSPPQQCTNPDAGWQTTDGSTVCNDLYGVVSTKADAIPYFTTSMCDKYPTTSDEYIICTNAIQGTFNSIQKQTLLDDASGINWLLSPVIYGCNGYQFQTPAGKTVCTDLSNQLPAPIPYLNANDSCKSYYGYQKDVCTTAITGTYMGVNGGITLDDVVYKNDAELINHTLTPPVVKTCPSAGWQTSFGSALCQDLYKLLPTPISGLTSTSACSGLVGQSQQICNNAVNATFYNKEGFPTNDLSDVSGIRDAAIINHTLANNLICPTNGWNTKYGGIVCNQLCGKMNKSSSSSVASSPNNPNSLKFTYSSTSPSSITGGNYPNVPIMCNGLTGTDMDICVNAYNNTCGTLLDKNANDDCNQILNSYYEKVSCTDSTRNWTYPGSVSSCSNLKKYKGSDSNFGTTSFGTSTLPSADQVDRFCGINFAGNANLVCKNAALGTCSNLTNQADYQDCQNIFNAATTQKSYSNYTFNNPENSSVCQGLQNSNIIPPNQQVQQLCGSYSGLAQTICTNAVLGTFSNLSDPSSKQLCKSLYSAATSSNSCDSYGFSGDYSNMCQSFKSSQAPQGFCGNYSGTAKTICTNASAGTCSTLTDPSAKQDCQNIYNAATTQNSCSSYTFSSANSPVNSLLCQSFKDNQPIPANQLLQSICGKYSGAAQSICTNAAAGTCSTLSDPSTKQDCLNIYNATIQSKDSCNNYSFNNSDSSSICQSFKNNQIIPPTFSPASSSPYFSYSSSPYFGSNLNSTSSSTRSSTSSIVPGSSAFQNLTNNLGILSSQYDMPVSNATVSNATVPDNILSGYNDLFANVYKFNTTPV